MKLSQALRLTNRAVVAIIATNVAQLTRELTPVILTTLTHFDKKQAAAADWHLIWEADSSTPDLASRLWEGLTLITGGLEGEHYRGLSPTQIDALRTLAASRKIPLLIATDEHQPLPDFVETVVVDVAAQSNPVNIPPGVRRIALIQQTTHTKELLNTFDTVVTTSTPLHYTVQERIAGVILAAGAATRFGSTKQLLDYHGQPFVRHVALTALHAGLSPIVLVTGANATDVEEVVQDLPIVVIRNETWQDGQSSSIRVGVASITAQSPGGVILLAADQPQVTVHLLGALRERHAAEGTAIIAPLAADRRANPILFDRDTFSDLMALTGDVGGRAIFSNYKVDYIPWHDESLLFDVDTQADYQKLLAWGVKE